MNENKSILKTDIIGKISFFYSDKFHFDINSYDEVAKLYPNKDSKKIDLSHEIYKDIFIKTISTSIILCVQNNISYLEMTFDKKDKDIVVDVMNFLYQNKDFNYYLNHTGMVENETDELFKLNIIFHNK